MTKNENLIREIIFDFESGKIDSEHAVLAINMLASYKIDIYSIENYWRSENLDDFVRKISIEPINDWQTIDDAKAIILINEILDSLGNDAILKRNSDALEKRFAKTTGSISSMIFNNDISDSVEILKELKKDTRIIL